MQEPKKKKEDHGTPSNHQPETLADKVVSPETEPKLTQPRSQPKKKEIKVSLCGSSESSYSDSSDGEPLKKTNKVAATPKERAVYTIADTARTTSDDDSSTSSTTPTLPSPEAVRAAQQK